MVNSVLSISMLPPFTDGKLSNDDRLIQVREEVKKLFTFHSPTTVERLLFSKKLLEKGWTVLSRNEEGTLIKVSSMFSSKQKEDEYGYEETETQIKYDLQTHTFKSTESPPRTWSSAQAIIDSHSNLIPPEEIKLLEAAYKEMDQFILCPSGKEFEATKKQIEESLLQAPANVFTIFSDSQQPYSFTLVYYDSKKIRKEHTIEVTETGEFSLNFAIYSSLAEVLEELQVYLYLRSWEAGQLSFAPAYGRKIADFPMITEQRVRGLLSATTLSQDSKRSHLFRSEETPNVLNFLTLSIQNKIKRFVPSEVRYSSKTKDFVFFKDCERRNYKSLEELLTEYKEELMPSEDHKKAEDLFEEIENHEAFFTPAEIEIVKINLLKAAEPGTFCVYPRGISGNQFMLFFLEKDTGEMAEIPLFICSKGILFSGDMYDFFADIIESFGLIASSQERDALLSLPRFSSERPSQAPPTPPLRGESTSPLAENKTNSSPTSLEKKATGGICSQRSAFTPTRQGWRSELPGYDRGS